MRRDSLGLERVAWAAGSAFEQGFCTMEFKRSCSPTIFAPSRYRQLDVALVARSGSKVATMASSCTVMRFSSIALDN